jgi:hypothetical protein
LFTRDPDQANGPDRCGALCGIPRFVGDAAADGEQTVTFQGVFQHRSVSWFEDVEWQTSVGKQGAIGQQHHAAAFGQF